MLDDPLANLKRQIQSRKIQIALFELLDDSQRLQVVIECPSLSPHQFIELSLSGMSKRRVSDVVNQRQRLDQLAVQPERAGNGPRDLPHLQRMGQPVPKMIRKARREHLGLRFQAAKRPGVNDAVAVPRVLASIR